MLAVLLVAGVVTGLAAARWARVREIKRHPETASMKWTERYRFSWAAVRHSRRTWILYGALFTLFGVLELVVLAIRNGGAQQVIGVVSTAFFFALAAVSFVQAGRAPHGS